MRIKKQEMLINKTEKYQHQKHMFKLLDSFSFTKEKSVKQIMDRFTDSQFLTKNTLFANLYASEVLSLSTPESDFIKLIFNKEVIAPPELFQFTYFHRRDKKILIYEFIFTILTSDNKNEILIMENIQKMNRDDIRDFLISKLPQKRQKIVSDFNKRVHFQYAENTHTYKLNMQFLPLFIKQRQFVKALILSDVNTFEFSDKGHHDKIYKKIPKQLLTVAFRKDTYEYKFIQSSTLDKDSEQQVQLNEKVINILNRKQAQNVFHSYIVPIEYVSYMVNIGSHALEDSYRSVLIRKNGDEYYCFVFKSLPYKYEGYKKI